jgi:hypothetical protein
MDQETKDREWQMLQSRIDQMFGVYLKDDVHKIEHKQGNVVHLLEMPLEYREAHQETPGGMALFLGTAMKGK